MAGRETRTESGWPEVLNATCCEAVAAKDKSKGDMCAPSTITRRLFEQNMARLLKTATLLLPVTNLKHPARLYEVALRNARET